mmetsp:Transcript_14371/g.41307  ORF Transcript_14371/g.41307 Transcript_14371/m.41307 type:complete len:247 (+) Transcript_14371:1234-1974(+)
MPPMPPIPPGIPPENGLAPPNGVDPPDPPKGLAPCGAPPPGPPPMPMFFNISAMFPISIPPIPPGIPPGIPPPPNGLAPAPPPNGLPPAPGPPASPPSLDFFLGPDRSSVNTSTSAALYSAYPSSFTAPPPAGVFFTPSTRASARALTNSLFSKKLLVETPSDCSSALSSVAFMLWHFSISSARRFSRSAPVGGDGSDDADSDRTFFFFLRLPPSVEVEVEEVEAMGVLPSARALVRASTSSLFSK